MKRLLLILLITPFLTLSAGTEDLTRSAGDELEIYAVRDSLPEDLKDIGGEMSLDGNYDAEGALERLWYRFLAEIDQALRDSAREILSVLALSILCALGTIVAQGAKQGEFIEIAGCAAASCILADGTNSLFGKAVNAISDPKNYANAALPAIYSAAAVSGAPNSSAARFAAASMGLDMLMTLSQHLIMPLLYSFLALAVCGSIFDHPLLRSVMKLYRKLATILMMGTSLLFTGFLSLTGIVAGSTDEAAIKAARFVISSGVPVVGKLMSDAAASVISAAAVVRNSAGAFGLVAVTAMCITPFVSFLIKRILFTMMAAAAEMTAGQRFARLLNDMSALMGLLLGLVASYGIMLFFSIVSAIRTVNG